MRRRHFLLAGAALTLSACSSDGLAPPPSISPAAPPPGSSATRLSGPPHPNAVPRSFQNQPVWPDADIGSHIKAVHQHHLCTGLPRASRVDLMGQQLHMPAVVDVTGPTTRLLLTDGNGNFHTREVDLASLADEDDSTLGPDLTLGAAVLDDSHAWLVVGEPYEVDQPGAEAQAVVHLVKVRLSNGQVEAVTKLGEHTPAGQMADRVKLRFTEDRSGLLVHGQLVHPSLGADFIGLRLDAADLAIQFDAHTVAPPSISSVSSSGDALRLSDDELHESVVLLDRGEVLEAERSALAQVHGSWCRYWDGTRKEVRLRNLDTAEETAVPDFRFEDLSDMRHPAIWSVQQELYVIEDPLENPRFSVWLPSSASPLFTMNAPYQELTVHTRAALGGVLYLGSPHVDDGLLTLYALDTGEVLNTIPKALRSWDVAVTPWGIATTSRFRLAQDWFPDR